MSRLITPLFLALFAIVAHPAHADRTYKVYKSNEFGRKGAFAQPQAIIEVDDFTGEAKVYEPNIFGRPDRFSGPKYIIESDSVFVGHHHHRMLPDMTDEHPQRHWTHDHDDYEGCEEE